MAQQERTAKTSKKIAYPYGTIATLAREAGVSYHTAYRWLRYKRPFVTRLTERKAKALEAAIRNIKEQ